MIPAPRFIRDLLTEITSFTGWPVPKPVKCLAPTRRHPCRNPPEPGTDRCQFHRGMGV